MPSPRNHYIFHQIIFYAHFKKIFDLFINFQCFELIQLTSKCPNKHLLLSEVVVYGFWNIYGATEPFGLRVIYQQQISILYVIAIDTTLIYTMMQLNKLKLLLFIFCAIHSAHASMEWTQNDDDDSWSELL